MRFKVDENLPVDVVEVLRAAGHDADTVAEEQLGGAPDSAVAFVCRNEQRALITLDRGFADIRAYPPADYAGIVVLRPAHQDKATVVALVRGWLPLLTRHPLPGHLWIVEPNRLRLRGSER